MRSVTHFSLTLGAALLGTAALWRFDWPSVSINTALPAIVQLIG